MPDLTLATRAAEDGCIEAELSNAGPELAPGFRLSFSMLAPCEAVAGCAIVRQHGGYAEVAPADGAGLAKGATWRFAVRYCALRHKPLNRSWGMIRPYAVSADGAVQPVHAGDLQFGGDAFAPAPVEIGPAPDLLLVPSPASFKPASGSCDLSGGLAAAKDCSDDARLACAAAASLAQRMQAPVLLRDGGLPLALRSDADLPAEGYRLELSKAGVQLAAGDRSGFLHGLLTLQQLASLHASGVPAGTIEDQPRFGWRGLHMDCARHCYAVPSILRVLDLMALLKLNRFHWHLIDDEAFRLELQCAPELAQQTAMRGHGCIIPGVFGAGSGPYGGTYSRSDVAAVIEHAQALGIEVMPEIEIPAHAWALLQVMPAMRDPQDRSAEVSVQGYRENAINPAMPATWDFLRKALPEVRSMFPFGLIHLGCDELPELMWTASPAIEAYKAEHSLADRTDVQEKMMRDAAQIVADCGGRPAAWIEAAQGSSGGIRHDALLFAWSNAESGWQAARAGYEVVMAPAQHTYLDMAPDADPRDRGMNWAAIVALGDTLAWEPVPAGEPELASRIAGVHGALWAETVLVDEDAQAMLMPRLLGVAETAWASQAERMSASALRAVAQQWARLCAAMDWQFGKIN